MILCVCKAVSDRDVAAAIQNGARTVAEVARCTRAGTGCGACRESIQDALDMAHGRRPHPVIVLPMVAMTAG